MRVLAFRWARVASQAVDSLGILGWYYTLSSCCAHSHVTILQPTRAWKLVWKLVCAYVTSYCVTLMLLIRAACMFLWRYSHGTVYLTLASSRRDEQRFIAQLAINVTSAYMSLRRRVDLSTLVYAYIYGVCVRQFLPSSVAQSPSSSIHKLLTI